MTEFESPGSHNKQLDGSYLSRRKRGFALAVAGIAITGVGGFELLTQESLIGVTGVVGGLALSVIGINHLISAEQAITNPEI